MKPSATFEANRDLIRQIVLAHRCTNPRVFGSVLHGNDDEHSDLDLLIDTQPDTSLLDIAQIQVELEAHLGIPIDVLTAPSLPPKFREHVLREAQPV